MDQVQISRSITKIEVPSYTYNHIFETNTSGSINQTIVQVKDNPISVEGDTINISGEYIQNSRYYPFEYKGKKFLLYRPSKKVTEIYKVK
jgi:hypothetical protein